MIEIKNKGITRKQVGLIIDDDPMEGPNTYFWNIEKDNLNIGRVTSAVYSPRLKQNIGLAMVDINYSTIGTKIDIKKAEDALIQNPDAVVLAFVHAKTSTGAKTDPKELVALAHKHDCLTICDTVTGLAGIPLMVDEWGIDAIYSGTQKCLSSSRMLRMDLLLTELMLNFLSEI